MYRHFLRVSVLIPVALVLLIVVTSAEDPPADKAPESLAASATGPVTRIVFVDKAEACACTRKRIDTSWSALNEALDGRELAIERIHSDKDAEKTQTYRAIHGFIVLPALYLMDADGQLVAFLQGELTAEQIKSKMY